MKKVTVQASSDIALVKYWGKKDEVLRLPENGSVSVILDGLDTVTTVEFQESLVSDLVTIGSVDLAEAGTEAKRVTTQLDRIRSLAGVSTKAKVVSKNSFPKGTGLSSSGSGMAALTVAAANALGLRLSEKEISILARQGSGTACRCACSGFVEWLDGETSETSFSQTIYSKDHWDIRDVVAVVSEDMKKVSSTEGHATAQSSPFFSVRQKNIKQKIALVKKALEVKDFTALGVLVEAEALEFHSILFTSTPPLVLWYPGTMQVMQAVMELRQDGIECYFTINTGFNVHVLTLPRFQEKVESKIKSLPLVTNTLLAKVGDGPKMVGNHLF